MISGTQALHDLVAFGLQLVRWLERTTACRRGGLVRAGGPGRSVGVTGDRRVEAWAGHCCAGAETTMYTTVEDIGAVGQGRRSSIDRVSLTPLVGGAVMGAVWASPWMR